MHFIIKHCLAILFPLSVVFCFLTLVGAVEVKKIRMAKAIIKPSFGNRAKGMVTFEQVVDGVKITADIEGLKPGSHGFHIHQYGDCGSDGSSAGGIFNPLPVAQYNPPATIHGGPDSTMRLAGDLGNVVANEKGIAHYERIDLVIDLNGPQSIIGHSIVIHEKEDDYVTQPNGGSGGAVGCGIIKPILP